MKTPDVHKLVELASRVSTGIAKALQTKTLEEVMKMKVGEFVDGHEVLLVSEAQHASEKYEENG